MNKSFKLSIMLITTTIIIIYTILHTVPLQKRHIDLKDFQVPTEQNIIKLLKINSKNKLHPRLIATKKDFSRIKKQIATDSSMAEKYKYITSKANSILKEPPVSYELTDEVRLLSVSRKALDRIQTLSFIYNISGDKKYADRAVAELMTISDDNLFPTWHPEHFLDTAEMTAAAAFGYDWLYNYLSSEQKLVIRTAILTKGLEKAMDFYLNQSEWVISDTNWNAVCNGGIGLGALAVADEGENFESISGKILANSIESLPKTLMNFNPDGGWFEGISYWNYALKYISFFLSALDSSLGTDYELSQSPGLSSAGDFQMYMTGTNGVFNFADSDAAVLKSPVMLWLGNKFQKGEYIWYYNKVASPKDATVMSLIWHNSSIKEIPPQINDKYFSNVAVVTMHSKLLDTKDAFIGFKAGNNNLAHGDLDTGTFIFDALGERWFHDLGSEDYNVPGYWDMGAKGTRWNYYKKSTEGHNALVINSKTNSNQNVNAKTSIVSFKSNENETFAIADLTDAYKGKAISVKRGISLLKGSGEMIVQDEISINKETNLWWFAHTDAQVSINKDSKSAVLSKNNKQLYVSVLSPSNATITINNAEPLPSSTKLITPSKNIYQKLSINYKTSQDTAITVLFSPYRIGKPTSLILKELNNWD